MTEHRTPAPIAEPYLDDGSPPVSWTTAMEELERSTTFWIATIHPASRPHVAPVLAVLSDGALHFAASPATQKARNLARSPQAVITTHGEELDLVIEGAAFRVEDPALLTAVARAYAGKYGWQVAVSHGALHGEGAPSAGPPPYHAYRLEPRRAYGFPTSGAATPTRWRFHGPGPRA